MFKTLHDIDVANKRILVRCDFNVPLDEKGNILDDFRIKASLPTIEYLIKNQAKIILMSHLGRPDPIFQRKIGEFSIFNFQFSIKSQAPSSKQEYTLKPVALRLEKLLEKKVKFFEDCIGEEVQKEVEKMEPGEVVVLENLRFHKEEEENDPKFSQGLAELADIFINDAFSVSHRSHASIVGITNFLPSGAGLLLAKEIEVLTGLMENPEKPLVAIIGGEKVETKVKLINRLSQIADFVLIGNLLSNEIREKDIKLKFRHKVIEPVDSAPGRMKNLTFSTGAEKVKSLDLDIGSKTREIFREKISLAKTIFWNGPLGKIEDEKYSKGTTEIAKAIVESGAVSIAGGGETVEFITKLGLADRFTHLSTGGGAMLEFLSGEKLPGIEALKS